MTKAILNRFYEYNLKNGGLVSDLLDFI